MDRQYLCNTLHFNAGDLSLLLEDILDEAARTGLLKRLLTDIKTGEFMDFREELLQFAESGKFMPKVMDGISTILGIFDSLDKEVNRIIGYLPSDNSQALPKVQMGLGLERKQ